jgi:hypothetical protein
MGSYLVELLAAGASGPAATIAAAKAELAHLRSALGSAAAEGHVRRAPQVNPMAGTNSMVGESDFVASVEVRLPDATSREAVLAAVGGCAARHAGAISPDRSVVLAGAAHWLRPLTPDRPELAIRLLVALRPTPGISAGEFRSGWLEVGKVNARNHPTCVGYGQLHADPELTADLTAAAGFGGEPFAGLAIEVFGSGADLRAGSKWAVTKASIDGSPMAGDHLMDLLGRYLDFSHARTVIVADSVTIADMS